MSGIRTWICLLETEFNPPHLLPHGEWSNDNHCTQTEPVGVSHWSFGEHPFFPPFLPSFLLLLFNKYLSIYLLGCAGSHGLSCPTVCGIWSSPARGGTHDPCIGRQILNQWTTREVPIPALCLRQLWPSCWSSWVQLCREGCLRRWSPGAEKSREKDSPDDIEVIISRLWFPWLSHLSHETYLR